MNNLIERLYYFKDLAPKKIWGIPQNKPYLIARDFRQFDIPTDVTYAILLGRGVFKWLAVRRDLIRLKISWRTRITETIERIRAAKHQNLYLRHWYLKGYLKAYEECRKDVRKLCHSERWQAPDNDKLAQAFLDDLKEEYENDNSD